MPYRTNACPPKEEDHLGPALAAFAQKLSGARRRSARVVVAVVLLVVTVVVSYRIYDARALESSLGEVAACLGADLGADDRSIASDLRGRELWLATDGVATSWPERCAKPASEIERRAWRGHRPGVKAHAYALVRQLESARRDEPLAPALFRLRDAIRAEGLDVGRARRASDEDLPPVVRARFSEESLRTLAPADADELRALAHDGPSSSFNAAHDPRGCLFAVYRQSGCQQHRLLDTGPRCARGFEDYVGRVECTRTAQWFLGNAVRAGSEYVWRSDVARCTAEGCRVTRLEMVDGGVLLGPGYTRMVYAPSDVGIAGERIVQAWIPYDGSLRVRVLPPGEANAARSEVLFDHAAVEGKRVFGVAVITREDNAVVLLRSGDGYRAVRVDAEGRFEAMLDAK